MVNPFEEMAVSNFDASTPWAVNFSSSPSEKAEGQAKNPGVPRTSLPWQAREPKQEEIDFNRETTEYSYTWGSKTGQA